MNSSTEKKNSRENEDFTVWDRTGPKRKAISMKRKKNSYQGRLCWLGRPNVPSQQCDDWRKYLKRQQEYRFTVHKLYTIN